MREGGTNSPSFRALETLAPRRSARPIFFFIRYSRPPSFLLTKTHPKRRSALPPCPEVENLPSLALVNKRNIAPALSIGGITAPPTPLGESP